MRYLSLDWIDALTAAVADSAEMAELANEHRIGVTQVVTNGPEGTVVYHLQVGDGAATFGAGSAHPEDVRFDQDWDTAVAVATGALHAQQAFITGRVRMTGDQDTIVASQPVFAALSAIFEHVRADTEFH